MRLIDADKLIAGLEKVLLYQPNAAWVGELLDVLLESIVEPPKEPPINLQPLQPIYKDPNGTHRFKENAIVRHLLDTGHTDLNRLAMMNFSAQDSEQFAQLIGYSVSGFCGLSYVTEETLRRVEEAERNFREQD